MKPEIIITVNFKGWQFEVYTEENSGIIKVRNTDVGEDLDHESWKSVKFAVDEAIEAVSTWLYK